MGDYADRLSGRLANGTPGRTMLCGFIDEGNGQAGFQLNCTPEMALMLIGNVIEPLRRDAFIAAVKAELSKDNRIVTLDGGK